MIGISVYKELAQPAICEPLKSKGPGRSKDLIDKRNTFLFHRFYFKSKIQGKHYPVVLSELSGELHLSSFMIQKIILAHSDDIMNVKRQQPTVAHLRSTWSYWVW